MNNQTHNPVQPAADELIKHIGRSMPQELPKHKGNLVRQTVLPPKGSPERKKPAKFWDNGWCFYEIGVGTYCKGVSRDNVGGVGFFIGNSILKKNGYRNAILRLFKRLARKPQGKKFEYHPSCDGVSGAGHIFFGRIYYKHQNFKRFPHAEAEKDLSWLIRASLPEFLKF